MSIKINALFSNAYAGRAHDTLLQEALIQAAEQSVGEYRKRLVDPVSDAGSLMDDDLIVLAMRDDVYVL